MRHCAAMLLLCLLPACRSPEPAKVEPVKVEVSGTLTLLPFDSQTDFTQLQVGVVDPGAVILNPTQPPLAVAPLDASQCRNNNCPFAVPGVPITKGGIGLVLQLLDQRAADAQVWAPLYTGIAMASTVDAAVDNKTDIAGCTAVGLTRAGFAKLAGAAGQDPGQMQARGTLVALALGRASEATMGSRGIPPPQAGVTVKAADPNVRVWYPAEDLASNQNSTASTGLFLLSPTDRTRLVITRLTLQAAEGDSHRWSAVGSQTVGSTPGHILLLEFQADN